MRNPKGQFIKGHQIGLGNKYRVGISPWNKGLTKENCNTKGGRKFGSKDSYKRDKTNYTGNLGMLGMRHSEESKLKVSKNNARYWLGKKNPIISGKNHHNWKGGVSPINEKIRKSLEYKLWREAVFKRDDYTCQECNIRGGKMHAHHIKPFSLFPELRFAIDNGATLCAICHRKTETYGARIRNILIKQIYES